MDSSTSDGSVVESSATDDLGCSVLGYVDENGVIQTFTDEKLGQQDTLPCFSPSFLTKRKSVTALGSSKKKKKTEKCVPSEIEPMAIRSVLSKTEAGRQVIEFIETNGFLNQRNQVTFMRIIFDHFTSDQDSPQKYYPQTSSKIAIAKGIVADFPQLADVTNDCPWMSWSKIVQTKFETVQSALPQSKKKNKPSKKTSFSQLKPKEKPTSSTTKSNVGPKPSTSTEDPQDIPENIDPQV